MNGGIGSGGGMVRCKCGPGGWFLKGSFGCFAETLAQVL